VLGAGGVLAARLRSEYRGESLGEAPARKEEKRQSGEWLIDGSGPVAAVLEKELRTLMRAMPFLYSLGAPLLMVFVFSSMFRTHHSNMQSPIALLLFLAYGLVGFTQLLYNNLGAEGTGIQMLFLSPTPIRTVILAKNLFHTALFAVEALLICIISAWRFGLPGPVALAAILCWLLFAVPAHLTAGDLFSITMPYRINLGRIGRQRGSQANALLSLLIQAGVLGVGVGLFALCAFFAKLWLAIPIFVLMAAGAFIAWMRVLGNVDGMANKRREELVSELVRAE
jgi:ABC-2 type transport system permease protein